MSFVFYIAPIIVFVAGLVLLNTSNVKINSIYGFRTRTSSKNQETWKYCNTMCAKMLMLVGAVSVIAIFVTRDVTAKLFGIFSVGEIINILIVIIVLLSVPIVNHSCRRKFPEFFNNNRD